MLTIIHMYRKLAVLVN